MASDVKVIFTPVGVQVVEGAFQRLKASGKQAGTDVTASMDGITSSMGNMATAAAGPIAAVAAVATVVVAVATAAAAELAHLALSARETEENIGKMADRVGGSVEQLSALHVAAVQSEVPMEALEKGLVKLAKAAYDAGNGSKELLKAFQ